MEREWSVSKETESAGWDGLQEGDGGGRRDWNEDQEGEERNNNPDDGSDGNACVQHLEGETTHSTTGLFTDSFSTEGD